MIFSYIVPALLISPILYFVIFRINHIFLSVFLGNLVWISLIISVFTFDEWIEDPFYFIHLILPITFLSLALSLKRILSNRQSKHEYSHRLHN